jgi:hypothetical protein
LGIFSLGLPPFLLTVVLELSVSDRFFKQEIFVFLGFFDSKLIKVFAVFLCVVNGYFHGFEIIVLLLVQSDGIFEQ